MPTQAEMDAWIRRNEAARAADLETDAKLSMSERLEQTVRLSRMVTELRDSHRPMPDAPGR